MKEKIIFFCLPPVILEYPPLSFSILASVLQKKGYTVEIKYWNFLLDKYMGTKFWNEFVNIEYAKLLPYFSIINEEYNDKIIDQRLITLFRTKKILDGQNYIQKINNVKSNILNIFDIELQKIIDKDILLFGLSAKLYQWIPALILSKKLKNHFTNIKIIMGGFGDSKSSIDMMHLNKNIDYAIYGEGEVPLLELCDYLKHKNIDISKLPRLVYKSGKDVILGKNTKKALYNMVNYPIPTFENYYEQAKTLGLKESEYTLPIEGSRGCRWNRCKFCSLNHGYNCRERSAESIVKEMECLNKKYGITKFRFMDNNLIFKKKEKFEFFLDILIKSQLKNRTKYELFAEIIPSEIDSMIVKKMAIAGFKYLQFGFESFSENLLKSMNKSTSFADNIFIIKFAKKYNIVLSANIIRGIPEETEEDIFESINNIHYLRFFIGNNQLKLNCGNLTIYNGSVYYDELQKNGKISKYNQSTMQYYLSTEFTKGKLNYRIFSYYNPIFSLEWNKFERHLNMYKKRKYTYQILDNGIKYYKEYCNGIETKTILLDDELYWKILTLANNKVVNLDYIRFKLEQENIRNNEEKLQEKFKKLKDAFLLYYNNNYSKIISIIDTDITT